MAKEKIVNQQSFSFTLELTNGELEGGNNFKGTIIIPAKSKEEALKIIEKKGYRIKYPGTNTVTIASSINEKNE